MKERIVLCCIFEIQMLYGRFPGDMEGTLHVLRKMVQVGMTLFCVNNVHGFERPYSL